MFRQHRGAPKTIVMFGGEELEVDFFPLTRTLHPKTSFNVRLLSWMKLARAKAHKVNMRRFKRGLRWVRRGDRLLLERKTEVGCQIDQAA